MNVKKKKIEKINKMMELVATVTNGVCETDLSSSGDEDEGALKSGDFVATIDAMNEYVFKTNLRMNRSTAEYLIARFSQTTFNTSDCNRGKAKIPPKVSIYMYIWYISNTITYSQIGELFGISKSCVWRCIRNVTSWLISISHEYITWPQQKDLRRMCTKFYHKQEIPNVIGAIDCTHINITAPILSKKRYLDRKQNYSVILQGIVDADKKFIDVYCGEPGSLNESRVLQRSAIYREAEENYAEMFPNSTFILGDSAYFNTKWIVPSFKDNAQLTNAQINFNKRHSDTRLIVENTFSLLKTRFRRLMKCTEQRDLNAVTNIICSICVIHNICITNDDVLEDYVIENPLALVNFDSKDLTRRDEVLNYLHERNLI